MLWYVAVRSTEILQTLFLSSLDLGVWHGSIFFPPQGPSTHYFRILVPNTVLSRVFGTRVLKCWVLEPFGYHTILEHIEIYYFITYHILYTILGSLCLCDLLGPYTSGASLGSPERFPQGIRQLIGSIQEAGTDLQAHLKGRSSLDIHKPKDRIFICVVVKSMVLLWVLSRIRNPIHLDPNVPLFRALWSLLDGIWGARKGSWGAGIFWGLKRPEMTFNRVWNSKTSFWRYFG